MRRDPLLSGPKELLCLSSSSTGLEYINHGNRPKILIRPVAKRVVQPQQQTRIILECFSSRPNSPSTPTETQRKQEPTAPPTPPPEPVYARRPLPKFRPAPKFVPGRREPRDIFKSRKTCGGAVMEGRIEKQKPRRPSPSWSLSSASTSTSGSSSESRSLHSTPPTPLPPALPVPTTIKPETRVSPSPIASNGCCSRPEDLTKCPCLARHRMECPRCRVLRLADRFCSIVTIHCEKWATPRSAPAIQCQ